MHGVFFVEKRLMECPGVSFMFVVAFLLVPTSYECDAFRKCLQIDLVVPGVASFSNLGTLNSSGPAFDTGLEVLRTTYPQQEWRLTFLPTPTCPEELITVQTRLAEWYYKVRRQNNLCVIITTGICLTEKCFYASFLQFELFLCRHTLHKSRL